MPRALQPFRLNMGSPTPSLLRGATAELAWIVLALSLGLTILAYCMLHVRASRSSTDARFVQANYSTSAIKARLDLSAELLRSTAAMLMLSRTVQNPTWQQYQRNLANQGWPAEVRQLGYAQHIRASEKTALSDAMRADAMPDYQIHPVRDQSDHAPILFIAPDTNNRAAERPGFDLLSSIAAKRALEKATDSGAITFHTLDTDGSILSIGGKAATGRAVMVLPLFPGNAVPPTVALRRKQVIGFVFAFIGIDEILHATDASPYRSIRLVELPDATSASAGERRLENGDHTVDVPFDLFGNRWQAEVRLPAVPIAQTYTGNAEIIALCGGIISLLLFAVTRLLAGIVRINRSHSKRTSREIRQLNQQLSATLLCSDYAIMTIDRRQRIMTFNPTAESIFGVGADTAIGIGLSRFLPHKLTGAKRKLGDAAGTGGIKRVACRLPNNPGELARRYHGEQFPFEATIYKCEHSGEPATMIFLKDITAEVTAKSSKTGCTARMTEAPDIELAQRVNQVAAPCPEAIHFEIIVGESISSGRFNWLSASTSFARQDPRRNVGHGARQDNSSSMNCGSTSVCEFIDTCIHADDRAAIKQLWRRAFQTSSDVDCLYRLLLADGGMQVMRHWMTPASVKGSEQRFAGLLHEVPQEAQRGAQLEAHQGLQQEAPRVAKQKLGPEVSSDRQMKSSVTYPIGVTLESQTESQPESDFEHTKHVEPQPQLQPELKSTIWRAPYAQSLDVTPTDRASKPDAFNAPSQFLQHGERRHRDSNVVETGKLYRQLKSRLLHFDSARDEQQKKLAREMHDDFGQLLTAMKMDLIALQTQLSKKDSRLSQQLGDVSDLVDAMVVSVRRIIANLPPEQIEAYGLVKGLELLAKAHSNRHKIGCQLHVKPHLPMLDTVLISPIYRIVQEALNNVAKHARAKKVDICIEHSNDCLHVRVTDDGCGITPSTINSAGGFGLIGMRERVSNLNGEMTIDTAIGTGTTIHITIPLEIELMP